MSESLWRKKGGSLSHKNACKEYGLTEDEIIIAINAEKLQYQLNYAHGNPYYKLLRGEVEKLAFELHGEDGVKKQEVKHKLKIITKEINSLKRKIASLERQKIILLDHQNELNE